MDQATEIVRQILDELSDRKGFDQELAALAPDDEKELTEKLIAITRFILSD